MFTQLNILHETNMFESNFPTRRMENARCEVISTKAGPYPVERRPSNWQATAGALEGSRDGIKAALRLLEEENHE